MNEATSRAAGRSARSHRPDRVALAGARMQLHSMRGNPDWFLSLTVAPLQTVVFVLLVQWADRGDLTAYAVLAPALMALWLMALQTSGELITSERENGSLEALLAAPGRFDVVMLGRIGVVTGISLLAFVESWLVGWALTGAPLPIEHVGVFVATLVAAAFAMSGWAGVMSAVFVLARTARTFQNSLSYPFFVLGGVFVPVSFLPGWLQPLSDVVFLSWVSDLLRDALAPAPVESLGWRLGAVVGLGLIGFALAHLLIHRALRRVRTTGSLSYA